MPVYTPTTSDIRVDTETTPGNQAGVQLARLAGGGFVAIWSTIAAGGQPSATFVQVFDAGGTKVGAESSFIGGQYQTKPSVTNLADGGFVVVWKGNGGDPNFYSAQMYNASGVTVGAVIIGAAGDEFSAGPQVAADPAGGFLIAFEDSNFGISAQRYSTAGSPDGAPVPVGSAAGSFDIAATPSGYVITYPDAVSRDIVAQLVGFDGSIGQLIPVSDISKDAVSPQITATIGGGFAVSWSYDLGGTFGTAVAVFDQAGVRIGNELLLDVGIAQLSGTSIAVLTNGELVVSYGDSLGNLFVQAITAQGVLSGSRFTADDNQAGSQFDGDIVGLANGGFTVAWDKNNNEVGARIFAVDGQPPSNVAPTVDLNGAAAGTTATLSYSEGDQPTRIAPEATVTDPDSPNFAGGTLTVSFTQNGEAGDTLNITSVGEGPGQIGKSGFNIRYEGVQIATFTGGTSGSTPLVITFDADATPAAISALLKQINYFSNSSDPSTAARQVGFVLADGDGGTSAVAVATINVAADNGHINGTSANDALVGTPQTDFFDLSQGGQDSASGLDENDIFYYGAAFDPLDSNDGGNGADVLVLQGNYPALIVDGDSLTNIESLSVLSGSDVRFGAPGGNSFSYNLTTVDANVAASARLTVNAALLKGGENFLFNGSSETDGGFLIYAGQGSDTLTGGAKVDWFFFGEAGRFSSGDRVNGGGGSDNLIIRGNYTGANAVVFADDAFASIETLTLMTGTDLRFAAGGVDYAYNLTMNDANVAAGQTLTANGGQLTATEIMTFNGSAESDGQYRIFGSAGQDFILAGQGNDLIYGGRGVDQMTGNGGNDVFLFDDVWGVTESAVGDPDKILDFTSGQDRIDLSLMDADTTLAGEQAFTFKSDGLFNGAGQLRAIASGTGTWFVEGDVNGDGVADFQIEVTSPTALVPNDFVL